VLDYSVLHEVWGSYGRRVVGRAIRHRRTSSATVGQVTPEAHKSNNGIDTLDLSVIHIDSSNYLPSRRVSAGGGRRLRRTFILRSAKKTLRGIRVVGQAMRPDSVGTDKSQQRQNKSQPASGGATY